MLPLLKRGYRFTGIPAFAFATVLFVGCSNHNETKPGEDATPLMEEKVPGMLPADSLGTDSLPMIDTTASTRPEQRKT